MRRPERVIACPAEARIERVLRHAGDELRQGEAILALDTSEVRLDLERQEERLGQIENDARQARLEIDETLAGLDSRVEGERLDPEMARYRPDRARRLDGDGLIAEEALKPTEVAVKKATIGLRRSGQERVAARTRCGSSACSSMPASCASSATTSGGCSIWPPRARRSRAC